MLAGFAFLYHKPQYSNIPTTMWLMALGKKQRDNAFDMIRIMLTGTVLFISALFTYITYEMNVSAFDAKSGLSPWIMFILIGMMLIWLGYWTYKVYKATKKAVSTIKRKKGGKK
jgi:spore maturation protein SpmA